MRTVFRSITMAVLIHMAVLSAQAASLGKLLRRATVAAACAASFADWETTVQAYHRDRAGQEMNPLFAGPGGRPRLGYMLGIKAAICGGTWGLSEFTGRHMETVKDNMVWYGANAAQIGTFTAWAVHNARQK